MATILTSKVTQFSASRLVGLTWTQVSATEAINMTTYGILAPTVCIPTLSAGTDAAVDDVQGRVSGVYAIVSAFNDGADATVLTGCRVSAIIV